MIALPEKKFRIGSYGVGWVVCVETLGGHTDCAEPLTFSRGTGVMLSVLQCIEQPHIKCQ